MNTKNRSKMELIIVHDAILRGLYLCDRLNMPDRPVNGSFAPIDPQGPDANLWDVG